MYNGNRSSSLKKFKKGNVVGVGYCDHEHVFCEHVVYEGFAEVLIAVGSYFELGYSVEVFWTAPDFVPQLYVIDPTGIFRDIHDGSFSDELIAYAEHLLALIMSSDVMMADVVSMQNGVSVRQICCGYIRHRELYLLSATIGRGSHLVPSFFVVCGYDIIRRTFETGPLCRPNTYTRIWESHRGPGCSASRWR